jgi:glycosyltransferase involved in cell wall biosynthesis
MKIVVDFRIQKNFSPSIAAFFEQLWVAMANFQPSAQYLLLTNEDVLQEELPGNITVKMCRQKGFAWFQQKKLLNTVNEYHADKYITLQEDGLSITTSANGFFIRKDLMKVSARVVFYKAPVHAPGNDHAHIKIVRPAFETVIDPISWAEAESIKTQYSGGRDFFLFTGDIDAKYQLIELLKAFSIFKKWQQSNMQLLIAGYPVSWTSWFEEKLSTYKYKQDVVLLKNLGFDEIAKLAAVAYAVLCPGATNELPLSLILSVQSHVAIIATDTATNRQFTNAALWIDKNKTEEGFGNAMILLYKDENQKQLLIQQVKNEAKHFKRKQMLKETWQGIKQK